MTQNHPGVYNQIMPAYGDFSMERDGTLSVSLPTPTNVAGWRMQYTMWRRFPQGVSGSVSGMVTKVTASGYGGGESGITVASSGEGRWSIALFGSDVSGGLQPGAYSYRFERLDSGSAKVTIEGSRIV